MVAYTRLAQPFYRIVDTQKMPAFVGLDGFPVPAGAMSYFDAGFSVADFDGNGSLDLAIVPIRGVQTDATSGSFAHVFLNNGSGKLTEGASSTLPKVDGTNSIAAADVNGDGRADLFVTGSGLRNAANGDPLIYARGGTTGLTLAALPSFDATNGPADAALVPGRTVTFGDLNRDGKTDVLVLTVGGPNNLQPSFELLNDGTGTFTQKNDDFLFELSRLHFGPASDPKVAIVDGLLFDANGDGAADLYVGFRSVNYVAGFGKAGIVALNDGSGNFSASRTITLPTGLYGQDNTWPTASISADFDGDGRLDLVLGESRFTPFLQGRGIQLLHNDGGTGFSDVSNRITFSSVRPSATGGTYNNGRQLGVIDFNQDGHPDIIERGSQSANATATNVTILLNDGAGYFTELSRAELSQIVPKQPAIAAGFEPMWGDFNGDGRLDFVLVDTAYDGTTLTMEYNMLLATTGYSTGAGGIDPADQGAPGFNEAYYLRTNADVRTAVGAGQYTSGLDHYLKVGRAAGKIGGVGLLGSDAADTLAGTAAAESAYGGRGNDLLTGAGGDDFLDGGAGFDRANFSGARSAYTISGTNAGSISVTDSRSTGDGHDTLKDIEALHFADKTMFVLTGTAASVGRLYSAAFARAPDEGGLGFQITNGIGAGLTIKQLAQNFLGSAEFVQRYGAGSTNDVYVTALYNNVLGRIADPGGYQFQLNALNSGQVDRADLLVNFADSAENKQKVLADWMVLG